MAFKPLSNRALCALSALSALVLVNAPAAAQSGRPFPGAAYSAARPALPPNLYRDPRYADEQEARVRTAGALTRTRAERAHRARLERGLKDMADHSFDGRRETEQLRLENVAGRGKVAPGGAACG